MVTIYHVDAQTKAPSGTVLRDYHFETPNKEEAESKFIRCWFSQGFWDVRIWMESGTDE